MVVGCHSEPERDLETSCIALGDSMNRITSAVTLLLFAGQVQAAFVTGNELSELCTPDKSDPTYPARLAECRGYVVGVYDRVTYEANGAPLCVNGNVTMGQVVKIFVAYAERNPASLHLPAAEMVQRSITEAFQCGK